MAEIVLGIFSSSTDAEYAITDLKNAGYDPKDISIMVRDTATANTIVDDSDITIADGAVTGATTGSILGGLTGLLVGIAGITIPGIGAFFVGGPIAATLGLTGTAAATLAGAATGAVAGGLVGALIKLGLPEEEARLYERRLNEGGILVAVPSGKRHSSEAQAILEENDADQVKVVQLDSEKRLTL